MSILHPWCTPTNYVHMSIIHPLYSQSPIMFIRSSFTHCCHSHPSCSFVHHSPTVFRLIHYVHSFIIHTLLSHPPIMFIRSSFIHCCHSHLLCSIVQPLLLHPPIMFIRSSFTHCCHTHPLCSFVHHSTTIVTPTHYDHSSFFTVVTPTHCVHSFTIHPL